MYTFQPSQVIKLIVFCHSVHVPIMFCGCDPRFFRAAASDLAYPKHGNMTLLLSPLRPGHTLPGRSNLFSLTAEACTTQFQSIQLDHCVSNVRVVD